MDDEAYQIYFVKRFSFYDLLRFKYFDPGTPQTNYIFFKLYTSLFGFSKIAARSLSVLVGISSILIIYLIARKLFSNKVGLLSAFIFAISPMHIYFSQEARPYSLYLLLTLISIYFFVIFMKQKENKFLYRSFTFMVISAYFHYYGIIMVATLSLFALFLTIFHTVKIKTLIKSQILSLLLLLPLIYMFFFSQGSGEISRGFFSLLEIPYSILVFSIGNTGLIFKITNLKQAILNNLAYLITTFLVFGFLCLMFFYKFTTRNKNTIFLTFYFFVPIILSILVSIFYKPLFRARYLIGALPAYTMILSVGFFNIRKNWLKIILITGMIILISFSLYSYYFTYQREPWEKIAKYIESNEKSDEVILGTEKWGFLYSYGGYLKHLGFWEESYRKITNKGAWLIYSRYNQGQKQEKQALKSWLDKNYKLMNSKEFQDDSNELSGNIIVYYYSK